LEAALFDGAVGALLGDMARLFVNLFKSDSFNCFAVDEPR
jgi:hypothetical protein